MSDYGSDYVTRERNRRWLPSKPWNRHPLSPTIPVAQLRLYKNLAIKVLSKSLTELPSHYYYRHLALAANSPSASISSRPPSSISAYRPSSVVSHSSSAPMDRATLSYPGTPTKSYGYLQQQHLSTLTSSYGRPSSVNLNTAPSTNRFSPDPQFYHSVGGGGSGTWSLGLNRQSTTYSDRHYPISPSSTIARQNVTVPGIHHHPSSSARTGLSISRRSPEPYGSTTPSNTGESSLREQIKNGLKYFADERKRLHQQQQHQLYNEVPYHSDHDLRYIPTTSSISPYHTTTGYGQKSLLTTPTPSVHHQPRTQSFAPVYPRNRQHRSESDLDALFNLYSHVPDPVLERRPLPGVSRVGGIPYTDTLPLPQQQQQQQQMSYAYLQRNASFPSIPSTDYINNPYIGLHYSTSTGPHIQPQVNHPQGSYYNQQRQHHLLHPLNHQQQHLPSIEHQRYAQTNPYTIYPSYGSATATHNRYSRSLDRYNYN